MPHAIPHITKHLESKGFQVLNAFPLEQADPTLDALALLIAFQFPLFGPLLQHMRGNIREKPGFHHNLDDDLSPNEVGTLKSLCQLLKANGLLEKWGTQGGNSLIRGVVANDERAFGFLTGGWLEGAVRFYIQQFLNLEGHEVEIAQNVQVKRPDGRNFEMDILLWVNGDLYWWEAKAGVYLQEHLDRYREVRQELGLGSKNCTLILGNLPREQDADRLENYTGFKIISPHQIPHRVEEIECFNR